MAIVTKKFVRKPIYVDAVRVTRENFLEMSFWCQGSIQNNDNSEVTAGTQIDPETQHIKLDVNNPKNARQTRAHLDDWILKTVREDKISYKIYTPEAFAASFDLVEATAPEADDPSPVTDEPDETEAVPEPHEPTPTEPAVEPHEPTPTEPVVPVEPVPTPQA